MRGGAGEGAVFHVAAGHGGGELWGTVGREGGCCCCCSWVLRMDGMGSAEGDLRAKGACSLCYHVGCRRKILTLETVCVSGCIYNRLLLKH